MTFSWRAALTARYDVAHLHWPEALVAARPGPRRFALVGLLGLWLARLVATRTPIVRTAHNVGLPDGLPRYERLVLRAFERCTCLWIRLNPHTETPPGRLASTIAHGHYRDWLADLARVPTTPGRLGYVGQVRRYKGVDTLIDAYRSLLPARPDATLSIGGNPTSIELAANLSTRAADLAGATLALHHLDEQAMVTAVTGAELVVLPYRSMHNSGTVLYALSLDRPVLVPDNPVTRDLQDEVGPGWVHRYAGELDATALDDALAASRDPARRDRPDLSRRDWARGGAAHADAYATALAGCRHRRRSRT